MDIFEFISAIISSISWPITTIVLCLILREPLKGLIPLLQRMRYKDFEMEFGRKLAEAREDAGVDGSSSQLSEPTPEESRIIELANVSPRAAVTESWRWVELASLNAAKELLGDKFNNKTFTFNAIRKLEQDERIDTGAVLLMRELRSLRNDAVHSPEFAISTATALEYAQMARQLVGYLKTVGGPNKSIQPTANASAD